jgi:Xaa-Pro aminopeptidase
LQSRISAFLEKSNLDGFLYIGDSFCDADMYYLSHFLAGDRFTLLAQDEITLLVSSMEKGRAEKESLADAVLCTSQYSIMEKLKKTGKPEDAYQQVLKEFLQEHGIRRLGVPFRFPSGAFQHLVGDFVVRVLESPASSWRAKKTPQEIAAITSAQSACERAMKEAVHLIAHAEIRGEHLYCQEEPLTSEIVRSCIEISLLKDGCESMDTIVAGGTAASDPHARGTGPLEANCPIVIDIFPRSKSLRYFADMTRTVLKGEASREVQEIYDAVLQAQTAGLEAVRAGVSGKEVHTRVDQVFRDLGYIEREGSGFTHSTGHGVGLDVHESPSLSEIGATLEPDHVVTVEPGLYYPEIGGVRLEDLVVVREKGCLNLTRFEKKLVL